MSTANASRRNLVVVRAGDNSVHPGWLRGEDRNFDIFVSYFGNQEGRYADTSEHHEARKGMKWPVLGELFEREPELIERYDQFWLPDDDLVSDTTTINRMFDLFRAHRLALAQPALTRNSYYTWPLLLQDARYQLRFTRFIEVMAPIFDRATLRTCLPTFTQSTSGWGLDSVWPKLLENEAPERIAIIDAVAVFHSRPVGGGELYKGTGISASVADGEALFARYGLKPACRADARCFNGGVRVVKPNVFAAQWQKLAHALRGWNYERLWRRELAKRARAKNAAAQS